jgi:hypothetical protein
MKHYKCKDCKYRQGYWGNVAECGNPKVESNFCANAVGPWGNCKNFKYFEPRPENFVKRISKSLINRITSDTVEEVKEKEFPNYQIGSWMD